MSASSFLHTMRYIISAKTLFAWHLFVAIPEECDATPLAYTDSAPLIHCSYLHDFTSSSHLPTTMFSVALALFSGFASVYTQSIVTETIHTGSCVPSTISMILTASTTYPSPTAATPINGTVVLPVAGGGETAVET